MKKMPIDTFLNATLKKISELRERLRSSAETTMDALPVGRSGFTGDAYVDAVGTVVHFEGGNPEIFYTPDALKMRDLVLSRQAAAREKFFNAVAAQLPAGSRVLNIGAGGDVTPIRSMRKAGHEVISTDLAENTVQALRSRIDAPAFACDLVNLAEILPEPVDFAFGNSTLAYIEPAKFKKVTQNVFHSVASGAIFTFDLAPHGSWFNIAEEKTQQTVANESDADPRRLLEYIKKHGVKNGINAMACFSFFRTLAVNLAMVSVLKEVFEGYGGRCVTGALYYADERGSLFNCLTLRVSKGFDDLLSPVEGETLFSDASKYLSGEINDAKKVPGFILRFIDRDIGEALARAVGIHRDRRSDPWLVAEYVVENQDSAVLPDSIKSEVVGSIDPVRLAEKILPYAKGEKKFVPPRPLSPLIAADQILHKFVISGELALSHEEADARIDLEYARNEENLREKADREQRRKDRKKQKSDRKKHHKK